MQLSFKFEASEVDILKKSVSDKLASKRKFVTYRYDHNVVGTAPAADDETLWMAHMMCLLTTQQRSGPNSTINMFLEQHPFPLSLEACRGYSNLEGTAKSLLKSVGIRRLEKIAKAVQVNLLKLEQGEWDTLKQWRDRLTEQRAAPPTIAHRELEEAAADYMDRFLEFGPKQSRNFWQSLGLTRYTFVLDSRILKWLQKNIAMEAGLLTSQGLSDNNYYRFISNMLLDFCNMADVLPCMFDAALFDSFDEGTEWTDEVIW